MHIIIIIQLPNPITLHSSFKILLNKCDPINPDESVTNIVLAITHTLLFLFLHVSGLEDINTTLSPSKAILITCL